VLEWGRKGYNDTAKGMFGAIESFLKNSIKLETLTLTKCSAFEGENLVSLEAAAKRKGRPDVVLNFSAYEFADYS